ncbi:uncharacterized protein LOC143264833 [Megachile rotundata]|uniref:uncharacterized protein LOC143264833 n=1 Tax=Megachile rotundata TaxID=143995 RepID=UPI003FD67604
MPKLNKLLVTSIIADIRECVCVANEIYSWVGGIEHLSWKFPTKIARDINAMEIVKEHEGTAGEFYILLLELAYDRIQFVLRLIVEFMDKYPFVDDFFKEAAYINRANHISMASLIRLVWDRLKTIPESISRQMKRVQRQHLREDAVVGDEEADQRHRRRHRNGDEENGGQGFKNRGHRARSREVDSRVTDEFNDARETDGHFAG